MSHLNLFRHKRKYIEHISLAKWQRILFLSNPHHTKHYFYFKIYFMKCNGSSCCALPFKMILISACLPPLFFMSKTIAFYFKPHHQVSTQLSASERCSLELNVSFRRSKIKIDTLWLESTLDFGFGVCF